MSSQQTTQTEQLGHVLIGGLGKTGLGLAQWCLPRLGTTIDSLTIYGGAASTASDETEELERAGVSCVLGTDMVEGSYDLAICAPGIPETSAFFHSITSHARTSIGEPEFAWRQSPEHWLAITGSNGKTTATYLTRDLLRAAGLSASEVGNIGRLAISCVDERRQDEWFVAELSSFQLAGTEHFHPRAAALLNISPDHVSWHGSFEAYVEAKERIFENLCPEDLAVISVDDERCRAIAERLHERGLNVCEVSAEREIASDYAAYVKDGNLVLKRGDSEQIIASEDELVLTGPHNMQNALVASALALFAGAKLEGVRRGLQSFSPLEHRIEPCGTWHGVSFVNDSKATNVDASLAAIRAYPGKRAVYLLGGEDKQTELDALGQALAQHAKAIVCYGEARERFVAELGPVCVAANVQLREADHLADAFERGLELCVHGDTLILSPACASHDEFKSFEERGHVFKQMVSALGEGE
ncbi:MAG: UDP-N-acetylmuramoyl-L-alanine--D-glutamate ligase [Atopobiaceae bacterium]|nr:UDP-N-acetylmuramoyl-L-alanine--D-glutamate ligase [Atopobiaceae bacterium]